MRFADIILPLPLEGYFTYSVPQQWQGHVAVGVRVVVPFGRGKSYVGLVARLHDEKPEGYEVKDLLSVMDRQPIVLPSQLKLWQWIADYYMSPIGEVYKAALPSGLKAEDGYRPRTETYIRLTRQFQNEQALHVALDMLARAPKQQEAFIAYLQLSGWELITNEPSANHDLQITDCSLVELLNVSGATTETVKALCKRGLLETYEVEVGRLNHGGEYHPEKAKKLNAAQQDAYNKILVSMMKKQVTLLRGVTSSGKTEIYIHLIKHELEQHRQVLYLLPEIALTVQMMDRLRQVFGSRLGIYHSRYSDAERVEIWQKQLSAQPYDIILGARSAVFLPFQRLGLVIVDEEHETSYKQQEPMPRYHARSAAIMMAAQQTLPQPLPVWRGIVTSPTTNTDEKTIYSPPSQGGAGGGSPTVLLGTATPSLETWHNARTGKYGLVELTERYQGIELPEIQVVDTADLRRRKMMRGPFSPLLLVRVREALESGKQAILFQNRRGWAPMVMCRQCGWVPRCEHCDVSLTLHRTTNQLTCHYCGFTYRIPTECPACGSKELQGRGYGTEKIEDQIRDLLPDARIARMDLDTTRSKNAYERIISDFAAGRTNLLIGTQMISKGLDFDRVAVVGILGADAMLNYPDFRAYEHAYMMMAQVSGRAGRKGKRGLVILQANDPKNTVIEHVVHGDYENFYQELKSERIAFHYPPFYRLIYVFLKHKSDALVDTAALEMGSRLRQWFGGRVLGPDKPAVAKVKTLCIRKLVLKLENGLDIKTAKQYLRMAQEQMMQDRRYLSLMIYYDVDPL